ncbi:AIPR family protein [Ralstonia sp.]|uniref:AIPR family protein n=1 Tax=Ralstonia sp. TaxID=54061 RepID=UPI002579E5ED|nr:AIPR family protein [Ralstonia sp.]
MSNELADYAEELRQEVRDRVDGGLSDAADIYSENVFTEIVMEQLSSVGVVENPIACHYAGPFGRSSVKINGHALAEDGDRMDLFTTIYVDAQGLPVIAREDIARHAKQALQFFHAACAGFHIDMEPSGDAHDIARSISEQKQNIDRLTIHVLMNGTTTARKLSAGDAGALKVKVEIWDIERLFRTAQTSTSREDIEIDVVGLIGEPLPCLAVPKNADDFEAYLAVVPGQLLSRLYDEYGSRLLELNVRSFLGVRGSKTVNSGIRKTLKDDPAHFLAYNNGIVLTADRVELMRLEDGGQAIRSLRGLQIVNGGQTTASIHRAHKHDKTDISAVSVPAKITVIAPERLDAMVQMISHYANSQNVVQPADFSANHPFHVQIEELARTTPCPDGTGRWFYERARGSYQVAQSREGSTPAQLKKFRERLPPQRKFTKPELARYLNIWDRLPHRVSFGAQKNFDFFMQGLQHAKPEFVPDATYFKYLIAKLILYRAVQRIVRQQKFPAYQANIVAYLVAMLAWQSAGKLDLDRIWRQQALSAELEDLIHQWSPEIDRTLRKTSMGRMVSEWAKKEECWLAVCRVEMPMTAPPPPEWPSQK